MVKQLVKIRKSLTRVVHNTSFISILSTFDQNSPIGIWLIKNTETVIIYLYIYLSIYLSFLTLIIYFWIRVVGTSSRIQNKNEISINLFPVCYQSLSIIFWREELDIQLGE